MDARRWLASLLVCFSVGGCVDAPPADDATAAKPAGASGEAGEAGASTPAPPAPPARTPGAMAEHDPGQVHFNGFGSARFGGDEASVRAAWPGRLLPETLAGSALCYYIEQDPRPEGGGIAFMFEAGRFVRYDVFGPGAGVSAAPGGFVVGSVADDILAAFGSRVEVQPHKYIEGGRYLILQPQFGEPGRVVFETGSDGRVRQWRVGVPPQVFYVEGCG